MITFEASFICDGQKVLGEGNTCLRMADGQLSNHKPDASLPAGWLAVLVAGQGRREMCPRCAGIWRERVATGRKPAPPDAEVEEFRALCRAFDWTYEFTDDHSYFLKKANERDQLLAMAERHPKLREIYTQKGQVEA
jgi:hypothetical protein